MSEKVKRILKLVEQEDGYKTHDLESLLDELYPQPLVPRITKSTAVASIKARFENDGDLLARFEIAKEQSNLWDGERDGLREAVKQINPGQFKTSTGFTAILSRTTSAEVMYPNASGKHQLENCLQTSIPEITGVPAGTGMIAFIAQASDGGSITPKAFLDQILHNLQTSKEAAISFLETAFIGSGQIVDNATLYSKKGSEKSDIAFIPPTEG